MRQVLTLFDVGEDCSRTRGVVSARRVGQRFLETNPGLVVAFESRREADEVHQTYQCQ